MAKRPETTGESLRSIDHYRQLAADCYLKIQLGKERPLSRWEQVDPTTNLYPCEIRLGEKLRSACHYLSEEGCAMVEAALALNLLAHKNQKRDGGQPYSTHGIKVTLSLAREHNADAIQLSSGLLHDAPEDTPISLRTIAQHFPEEVVNTVADLSKMRGRYQRRKPVEERSNVKILASVADNARVAVIKIHDKLHNMRTLQTKRGRRQRLAIIRETQDLYVPLARLMGLFDEANELDVLSLVHTSREHAEWARKTAKFINKFFRNSKAENLAEEITMALGSVPSFSVRPRIPTVADIYRRMGGELREVGESDMYLNIDIVHDEFRLFREGAYLGWGRTAMSIANYLSWHKDFKRTTPLDVLLFREEIERGLTDSLSVGIVRVKDNVNIKVNIYPSDAYRLEQSSLAQLYRVGATLDEKTQRENAQRKQQYLAHRLAPILTGEVTTSELMRRMEPRLPEGFVRVIGVNDKGEEEPWTVREGATIMDYARDIAPERFHTAIRVQVTMKDGRVYPDLLPNYVLQSGDKVHITFDPKQKRWEPLWIHCFSQDEEGREQVRRNIHRRILKLLERGTKDAEFEKLRNRIYKVGEWRVEEVGGIRHLRTDERLELPIIREFLPDVSSSQEFFFNVGMGEVPDSILEPLTMKLRETNRKVLVVRVYFEGSQEGQLEAVARVAKKINLISARTDPKLENVSLYINPDDSAVIEKLVSAILRDKRCQERGLDHVTVAQNFPGSEEEYYSVRG